MKDNSFISLPEKEFLPFLEETIAVSGNIGDGFPVMVAYNVPCFVLKNLWPARYNDLLQKPQRMSFAIAETGWRGKAANIQSILKLDEGRAVVEFSKSYVIDCEALLVAVKCDDDLALVNLTAHAAGQTWQSRNENDICFTTSKGQVIDHFKVSGSIIIPGGEYQLVKPRDYARLAIQIPRREFTGLAAMALGIMKFHGVYGEDELLASLRETIFSSRKESKIQKNAVVAAAAIIDELFKRVAAEKLHPFWPRALKMKQMMSK